MVDVWVPEVTEQTYEPNWVWQDWGYSYYWGNSGWGGSYYDDDYGYWESGEYVDAGGTYADVIVPGHTVQQWQDNFATCAWPAVQDNWVDPIAQTFYTDNAPFGLFVTSIDLYFKAKGTSPITLELRDTVNGYPGNNVIPFSSVTLNASDVNVSSEDEDGVVTFQRTVFTFPSPVYLSSATEYCFVVLPGGNDPGFELWVSELGENEVGTTTRISEQPAVGVLFHSGNARTWTAEQAEDVKFNMYRARFDTTTTATAIFDNQPVDFLKFSNKDFDTIRFASGDRLHSFKFTITNGGSAYTSAPTVTVTRGAGDTSGRGLAITAELTSGVVTSLTVTSPGRDYTVAPTLTFSGGAGSGAAATVTLNVGIVKEVDVFNGVAKVYVTNGKFAVGQYVSSSWSGNTIVAIENKVINAIKTNFKQMDFATTLSTWAVSPTLTGAAAVNTTYEAITFNDTHEFDAEYSIMSYSNEQALATPGKSFKIRSQFSSQTNMISPVIDLSGTSVIGIRNDVNNDSTNETTNSGSALSKYISRRVVLDDGQDAEDLKVYLSVQKPSGTDVKVYAKLQNGVDDQLYDNLDWVEMENTSAPSNETEVVSYAEYEYDLPDAVKSSSIYTYTNVGVSSIAITTAGSGYTTAPVVTISGGGGFGATAISKVSGGVVTELIITDPGYGYTGGTLAGVVISGTAGQFTCTATSLAVGDTVRITGSLGGTGTITGYTTGKSYKVSSVTGSVGAVTGFTLQTTLSVAIVTTVGTPTGLTYTSAPAVAFSGGGGTLAAGTAVLGTTTFSGYKSFAVKVVPLSDNTSVVPKVKELRAIALQV
jgi:hypothetical protein